MIEFQPFSIPQGTYYQEDYYAFIPPYFVNAKLYNSNLLQFVSNIYLTIVQDYTTHSNIYIDALLAQSPIPHANPWNIYPATITPPSPPSITGWPTDQANIVNAINGANTSCYNVAVNWIDFIVTNAPPPQQITNVQAWNIANDYYVNLLIRQYQGLPVATKTIAYFAYWYLLNVRTGFDLEKGYNPWYAVGKQLDVIGNFFGLRRNVSFKDTIGNSYATLTDSQFRIVLMFIIACWGCNFSYGDMARVIYKTFQNQVNVSSNQDMTITYFIAAPVGSDMYIAICALLSQKLLPAPMGVWARFVVVSTDPRRFFSFPVGPLEVSIAVPENYGFATGPLTINRYQMFDYGKVIIS